MAKPTGQQGSWYARWDGEDVPCIHSHPTLLHGTHYKAPIWDSPERHRRYFEDIQRLGKVILTKSRLGENGHYVREGYIGLFRVTNAVLNVQGEIELDLAERLVSFR